MVSSRSSSSHLHHLTHAQSSSPWYNKWHVNAQSGPISIYSIGDMNQCAPLPTAKNVETTVSEPARKVIMLIGEWLLCSSEPFISLGLLGGVNLPHSSFSCVVSSHVDVCWYYKLLSENWHLFYSARHSPLWWLLRPSEFTWQNLANIKGIVRHWFIKSPSRTSRFQISKQNIFFMSCAFRESR